MTKKSETIFNQHRQHSSSSFWSKSTLLYYFSSTHCVSFQPSLFVFLTWSIFSILHSTSLSPPLTFASSLSFLSLTLTTLSNIFWITSLFALSHHSSWSTKLNSYPLTLPYTIHPCSLPHWYTTCTLSMFKDNEYYSILSFFTLYFVLGHLFCSLSAFSYHWPIFCISQVPPLRTMSVWTRNINQDDQQDTKNTINHWEELLLDDSWYSSRYSHYHLLHFVPFWTWYPLYLLSNGSYVYQMTRIL